MLYHFNFQTQANFDDIEDSFPQDHKSNQLPTTTHNSPGSVKSSASHSFDLEHSIDISFEENTQASHANNVWNTSVQYVQNYFNGSEQQQNGFNSAVFCRSRPSQFSEEMSLNELMRENTLLRGREKNKFIQELQKETELCSFITQLMFLFNPAIFHEFIYVIQNVWERSYLPYRERKSKQTSVIPQFNCFVGFEGEQENLDNIQMYDERDSSQIKEAAMKGIEELCRELFFSKKLKLINFQDVKGVNKDRRVMKEHFITFLKVISKSVFLSAEGIYEDDCEEQVRIPIFSEQDQEECEPMMIGNTNKFVRTFSQIQQDDEFYCSNSTSGKRRKLF